MVDLNNRISEYYICIYKEFNKYFILNSLFKYLKLRSRKRLFIYSIMFVRVVIKRYRRVVFYFFVDGFCGVMDIVKIMAI